MDGWMDGEDLIIWIALWTLYKRCPPLTSDDFRTISIASRNRLRFASLLGGIFDGFGGQNGRKNRRSSLFFSMLFSNASLHRFFLDFWRLETLKIAIFPRKNNDFCQIGVFEKNAKNIDFGVILGGQNKENSMKKPFGKRAVFQHRILSIFSSISVPFWSPKIDQKLQKFEKMDIRRRPLKHYCFGAALWMDFERLGARF